MSISTRKYRRDRKTKVKHLALTIKLIGTEIRLVITKVLDFLASPYWKLYNELTNRDFRRNPAKYRSPQPGEEGFIADL